MNDKRNLLQESMATIQRLQARLVASEAASREPIAIIGAGCRYPGDVESTDDLWRVVRDGVDAVSEIPADRWDVDAYYDPDPAAPNKMVTRRAGFVAQVDRFDPKFFGISPREAQTMDPQQRLLLETAHEALENAGLAIDQLAGSATGVFVGITTSDYARMLQAGGPENSDVYSATGGALNAAAGRISFTFGLQGPCVALDTACSSSLVATHLACKSLRSGESDLALAGGVNLILSPDAMVLFSKWGMMAPDGACKTFDAGADGFVRAEGCAVIALRRLSDAIAAGDPILAVIRGSAVNSDGRSSGLTVPNGPAQEAVLRKALADAGLKAADIDYVEAHGTGTPLGDPIEVEALGAVMGAGRPAGSPLRIGSVKTNLGHTEAASGLAGLLKTAMALRHETLPPSLHFSEPNPRIDWERLPVEVQAGSTAWPRSERVRRAGVSSFGFSGTNAHIILEEAPVRAPAPPPRSGPVVLPLSARSESALRDLATRYADAVQAPGADLHALTAAAGTGRSHLTRRAAVTGEGAAELAATLRAVAAGETLPDAALGSIRAGERPKVAFLFTGQGAQYAGMGRGLYDREPVFRAIIDRAQTVLADRLERPLTEVLFDPDDAALRQTAYTQPALFALEYALAEQWRAWGVTPAALLGHSVGEYVAACVAGVFDFESGLELIAARGRAMQDLPEGGAMAAIFATADRVAAEVAPYADRLSVAGLNGPEETVIAGAAEAVDAVLAAMTVQGVEGRRLDVSHAFHSPLLEPMLGAFEARAASLTYAPPKISLISNLTGRAFGPGDAPDAGYWRRHAREPVRFAQGIDALRQAGITALVEIGPHPTLVALASRAAPDAAWAALPSLRRGRDDQRQMLQALGGLYVRGQAVNWSAFAEGEPRRRAALPTYPFQRERAWIDAPPPSRPTPAVGTGHPLLGSPQVVEPPNAAFAAVVGSHQPSYLAEHLVLGRTLFPGAALLEIALAAARTRTPSGEIRLKNFSIDAPLALPEGQVQTLVTQIDTDDGGTRINIRHAAEAAWRNLARCEVDDGQTGFEAPNIGDLRKRGLRQRDIAAYRAHLEDIGLQDGPNFQALRELHSSPQAAIGRVELPADTLSLRDGYFMHPAMLEAAFQVVGGALSDAEPERRDVLLPIGAESIRWFHPAGARVWVGAEIRSSEGDASFTVDLSIESEAGERVGAVIGLLVRRATHEDLERALTGGGPKTQVYRRGWKQIEPRSGNNPGHCLVLGSAAGIGSAVADALAAAGAPAAFVAVEDASKFVTVLAQAKEPPAWVIDCGLAEARGRPDAPRSAAESYGRALSLIQAMAASAPRAGLGLLSLGAQSVAPGDVADAAQVAVLGLARSAEAERSQAPVLRLDLDPGDGAAVSRAGEVFLALAGVESEAAIRQGSVFVPRLEPLGASGADGTAGASKQSPAVRGDGVYLVTGGLGGLGLATARWLADSGAGEIVLTARREPTEEQKAAVSALPNGAKVRIVHCDVADEAALKALTDDLLMGLNPLRGVFHTAGVVDDGVLDAQDAGRYAKVAAPKSDAAWRLSERTWDAPLDFFVLFSSASAVFGSPGQANYSASNAFLDGLAAWRRFHRKAATSIAWGAWDEVGMASKLDDRTRARWARAGLGLMPQRTALAAMADVLAADVDQAAILALEPGRFVDNANRFVAGLFEDIAEVRGRAFDTTQRRRGPAADDDSRRLAEAQAHSAADQGSAIAAGAVKEGESWRERIAAAPENRRWAMLRDEVRVLVAGVLGASPRSIDFDEPLRDLGLDSLMAVELRNRLGVAVGRTLPVTITFDCPTTSALVAYLRDERIIEVGDAAPAAVAQAADRYQDQSEAELAATLAAKLDGLKLLDQLD